MLESAALGSLIVDIAVPAPAIADDLSASVVAIAVCAAELRLVPVHSLSLDAPAVSAPAVSATVSEAAFEVALLTPSLMAEAWAEAFSSAPDMAPDTRSIPTPTPMLLASRSESMAHERDAVGAE